MNILVNLKFFKSYMKVIEVANIYFNIVACFLEGIWAKYISGVIWKFYAWQGPPVNKFLMTCF